MTLEPSLHRDFLLQQWFVVPLSLRLTLFLFRLFSQRRPHWPLFWSASLQALENKHANEAIFQSELLLTTLTASLITYVSYYYLEKLVGEIHTRRSRSKSTNLGFNRHREDLER